MCPEGPNLLAEGDITKEKLRLGIKIADLNINSKNEYINGDFNKLGLIGMDNQNNKVYMTNRGTFVHKSITEAIKDEHFSRGNPFRE
jgi:hypothetical protein